MATNNAINVATAATGKVLQGQGVGTTPAFSTATYPATTTINQILYSSAANTVTGLTTANNSLLLTNGSGVPSLGVSLANSFTFAYNVASAPLSVTINNQSNTTGTDAFLFVQVAGTSGGKPYAGFNVAGSQEWAVGIDNGASVPSTFPFKISAGASPGSGDCIEIATNGYVLMPKQPAASVYVHTPLSNVTGDGTTYGPVIFDASSFDQASNYGTGTGLFTAPVAGIYRITTTVTFTSVGAGFTSGEIQFRQNGATITRREFNPGVGDFSTDYCANDSYLIKCAASDTLSVYVVVSGSTKTVGIKADSFGLYSYATFQLEC